MKHPIYKLVFLLLFTVPTLSLSAQDITGTYKSNFPEGGFFVTSLTLHADGTFDRWLTGDMQRQRLWGKYVQQDGKVYLKIEPKKDAPVDLSVTNVHSYTLKQANGIAYHLLYHIGKKRLYAHSEKSGKRIVKQKNYSKNRRQKYYLQKVK